MCVLTEALQPWKRDTTAAPVDQVLVGGAMCWFWDQCWRYPTWQRKQWGIKRARFPRKTVPEWKGFSDFLFLANGETALQETEQLYMIF